MPWDPAPTPVASSPAPAPANIQRPAPQPQPLPGPTAVPTTSAASSSSGGVHIKTEPGTSYDLQNLPPTNGATTEFSNQIASQRAAAALQAKFGPQANASLNAMSARTTLAAPGAQAPARPQNTTNPPPLTDEQRRHQQEQYLRAQRAHHQQAQQRQQAHAAAQYQALQQSHQRTAAISKAQTDGAADWDVMVAQRRAEALNTASGSPHADMTIRQQVELMSRDMEGGGLMRPLSEHPIQHKRRKVLPQPDPSTSTFDALYAAQVSSSSPLSRSAQTDGPNDTDDDDGVKDEDLDEDAINSDLDDPDDNAVDETGEDGKEGEVMLCTYDKVARVKNKWKCTLKDGVLTTGGKE